jgi:hypothetical protein
MFPFEKEADEKPRPNKGFEPFDSADKPEAPSPGGSKRDTVVEVLEKHGVMDVDTLADDLLDALGMGEKEDTAEEPMPAPDKSEDKPEDKPKAPPKKGMNPFADKKNKLM